MGDVSANRSRLAAGHFWEKLMMEQSPCGKKRNSLSREDEGQMLPENKRTQSSSVNSRDDGGVASLSVNKRMQSTLVITGPDGKFITRDGYQDSVGPWSARSKFNSSGVNQQLLRSRTCDMDGMMESSRMVTCSPSQPIIRQPGFWTPQPLGKSGLSHIPHPHQPQTPRRLPKTPLGSDYVNTPATQMSKARPPLSSNRKIRSRAVAKLRMLDDQELQASRLVQARHDLLVDRQGRAYIAWLNHILDRPVTGVSRISNFEDFVSRNSAVTPPSPNPNLHDSAFKLIDGVYWDEDCVACSPRDPAYLGRSPRTPLVPLNGVGNRGYGSPVVGAAHNSKRSLKDVFSTPDKKTLRGQSTIGTPHLSSKRLKMITEHGVSYSRDAHMQDVCSLSELTRRLKLQFNKSEREEILAVITQLAKHIDEGRLRMKKGCAILADVALRKKALLVLMNYSAYWMRIGLYVVLGHTALLKEGLSGDDSETPNDAQDAEFAFLEVFLERHFLAHPGLAKKFASNKAIEGLYRDGFSEALGRVILKRFFLLVLVLDKAKCQTKMKIMDGIDGVDGGSPPLFRSDASVKSSRQALQEFLSDVMHGEGDAVGNLSALGYHVHHYQLPLADYNFAVVDLIEDLRDGVRVCRLVQLLSANVTFFLEHIKVPSNGRRRQLHNCQIALESLAQAGVPLEDEDESSINAEDIVGGNRDKVLPLLWNVMVHLQIPLLVSRPRLCQEIAKLQGAEGGVSLGLNIGTVELLLKWTQVACMIAGNLNVQNFKTSFGDGQALCLIVNLYLPDLLPQNALLCPTSSDLEDHGGTQVGNTPDIKVAFTTAYKKVVAHNFGLVQDVARKLGGIPEVLQLVDLLDDLGVSETNIIIFVAFLCSRLLKDSALDLSTIERDIDVDHRLDELRRNSSQCNLESKSPSGFNCSYSVPWPQHEALYGTMKPQTYGVIQMNEMPPGNPSEDALGKICRIQAWWRGHFTRKQLLIRELKAQKRQTEWLKFSSMMRRREASALNVQCHWRGYLVRRMVKSWAAAATVIQVQYRAHVHRIREREEAAYVLQYYFRAWAQKRRCLVTVSNMCKIQALCWAHEARGEFLRERQAVQKIETEWLHYVVRRRFHFAHSQWKKSQSAQIIQAHWRGYTTRQTQSRVLGHIQPGVQNKASLSHMVTIHPCWPSQSFEEENQAAEKIQTAWRQFVAHRKMQFSTIAVPAQVRGWDQRSENEEKFLHILKLQAMRRGTAVRVHYRRTKNAVEKIQMAWRQSRTRKRLKNVCVVKIQSMWRAYIVRKLVLHWAVASTLIQSQYRAYRHRKDSRIFEDVVVRCQALCRGKLARRRLRVRQEGAIRIQGALRGMLQRCRLRKETKAVIRIQCAFRAWHLQMVSCQDEQAALLRHKSATLIQTVWKKYGAKKLSQQFAEDFPFYVPTLVESGGTAHSQTCDNSSDTEGQLWAALRIQSWWRGRLSRKDVGLEKENIYSVENTIQCQSVDNLLAQNSLLVCQRYSPREVKAAHLILSWLRTFEQRAYHLRLRRSTIVVQRHIRGWIHRSIFARMKNNAILVQAHWRGYAVRRDQSPAQDPLGNLRQRMQITAATIQDKERLCNRLTEALSLLLCEKTVSGLLSTCRTIDVATQHSSSCCERLEESGAITTILNLMQTINRSPPLEQVLKHALSVLHNLACYPPLATRIARAPSAISIISQQLHTFRNNEEVFAQGISVLQIVCKTPAGIDVLQRERPVFRRLQLIAQLLERKVKGEKRHLEKLPSATAGNLQWKSAQKKMSEATCQFLSTMALMKDINRFSHYQAKTAFATPMRPRHLGENNPEQSTRSVASCRAGPKRVSFPSFDQRSSRAKPSSRMTDVPFHDRSNLF